MKKFGIYIFMILCLLTACQGPEIDIIPDNPVDEISTGEVTLTFGVNFIGNTPRTKAMGDLPSQDISSLHLLLFDENGYYIEAREAELVSSGLNPLSVNHYRVTLNLTDKKRIIHFIANCPVSQLDYGHENDVIANLYVTKANNPGDIETAYWHRIEVPKIVVDDNGDVTPEIKSHFQNIPLLRNYTQITVVDNDENDDFHLESFGVYNTIAIGTVAPYNKAKQCFQSFYDQDEGAPYSYDQLLSNQYQGHALAKVQLDGTLSEDDLMSPGTPFYMYERKISVHTQGEETQWDESPTHIILKGIYKNSTSYSYYKVDLVREVNTVNQYYNLLRNFDYRFILKSVSGPGYKSLDEAMRNPAGNNLTGSSETLTLTDVSDGRGRIMVSFADTTLTSSDDVKLRFKYFPDANSGDPENTEVKVTGVLDGNGSVLKGLKGNINYNAVDGWAEVSFRIQELTGVSRTQEIVLVTEDNTNLHKTITFHLVDPYNMDVICYNPKSSGYENNVIEANIEEEVGVQIRIRDDFTENLFPLYFYIEADKLSISPDVQKNKNLGFSLPVETGTSIIPGKNSPSFHYVYTLTYDQYRTLSVENNKKIIDTRWYTNIAKSASHVVAYNKYFNVGTSYFKNSTGQTESQIIGHDMAFSDLKVDPSPIFYGAGQNVSVSFDLDAREVDYLPKTIHITLEGLACAQHDHPSFDIYLTDNAANVPSGGFQEHTWVVVMPEGSRTVVLDDLQTLVTDEEKGEGPVTFTITSHGYAQAISQPIERVKPQFTQLSINPDPILAGAGRSASVSFTMDVNDDNFANRQVKVTLNRLKKKNTDNDNIIYLTPQATSRTVTINDLETIDATSGLSFTVEAVDGTYEPATLDNVVRRNAEFSGLKLSPNKILAGSAGDPIAISFRMDMDDEEFESTPVTITLVGMATAEGSNTLTVYPEKRNVTVDDLILTANTVNDEIYFTVKANGYTTATSTKVKPYVPEFQNMRFTQNDTEIKSITSGEIVNFDFTMNHFVDDMEVTITMDGLEPEGMPTSGPGSISLVSTRAAGTYIYKPTGSNCSLTRRTLDNPTDGKYTVTLSAYDYQTMTRSIDRITTITIPAGNIVTTISDRDFSNEANFKTIYLYNANPKNNNSATPIAQYTITREQTATWPQAYRKAYNTDSVELPAGSATVYIKYQQSNTRTYYGSFNASTASTQKVEVTLTQ